MSETKSKRKKVIFRPTGWDLAILDAKKRIEKLQSAIATFEENKRKGEIWHGNNSGEIEKGFLVKIFCHTTDAFKSLTSPEVLRVLVADALEQGDKDPKVMLSEEIDFTLEVNRIRSNE